MSAAHGIHQAPLPGATLASADEEPAVGETRAALERRIRRLSSQLTTCQRDARALAERIAHDLQSPMRALVGHVRLLRGHAHDDDASLDCIRLAAEQMSKMLEGMLTYCRLEPSPGPLATVSLGQALGDAARAYPALDLVTGRLPRLPAEPEQLRLLTRALVDNAWRFRSLDRPARLTVTAERQGKQWELYFDDDGAGLRPGQEHRALELFARCHARSAYPQGEGIGLALCRRIARLHGGDLHLEQPASGSGLRVVVIWGDRDEHR